ncbi:hypothetical protein AAHA92_34039 [Salvia divinorum]|uniref:Secreted protein n=1 Tax=Salvia divinorum TaxID=28513 RepID=A0ABD1FHQ7_SALDI
MRIDKFPNHSASPPCLRPLLLAGISLSQTHATSVGRRCCSCGCFAAAAVPLGHPLASIRLACDGTTADGTSLTGFPTTSPPRQPPPPRGSSALTRFGIDRETVAIESGSTPSPPSCYELRRRSTLPESGQQLPHQISPLTM